MFNSKSTPSTRAKKRESNSVLSGTPRIAKISLFGRFVAFIQHNIQHLFSSFTELWRTPFATLMTVCV